MVVAGSPSPPPPAWSLLDALRVNTCSWQSPPQTELVLPMCRPLAAAPLGRFISGCLVASPDGKGDAVWGVSHGLLHLGQTPRRLVPPCLTLPAAAAPAQGPRARATVRCGRLSRRQLRCPRPVQPQHWLTARHRGGCNTRAPAPIARSAALLPAPHSLALGVGSVARVSKERAEMIARAACALSEANVRGPPLRPHTASGRLPPCLPR